MLASWRSSFDVQCPYVKILQGVLDTTHAVLLCMSSALPNILCVRVSSFLEELGLLLGDLLIEEATADCGPKGTFGRVPILQVAQPLSLNVIGIFVVLDVGRMIYRTITRLCQ
jgi:hypothetical protein